MLFEKTFIEELKFLFRFSQTCSIGIQDLYSKFFYYVSQVTKYVSHYNKNMDYNQLPNHRMEV